ncbi:MAG: asparagine synthase (glutamine-hydrolyzing) [Thermodesulfobacteriota bacterium]|nr:asparagine synthase (glutamine-hydrolyzing) [Thermodesulfobacteriota bacterium]
MCGICGKINFNLEDNVDPFLIRSMVEIMHHRGPDAKGYLFMSGRSNLSPLVLSKINKDILSTWPADNYSIGLGHCRLSIIDISSGHQPMSNENKTIWIVFNGEIYNYRILRRELIQAGHTFRTNSDTEVILHGYEEYGLKFVDRLSGMFAVAIWDNNLKRLVLARDRFGEKPIYYKITDSYFIFASELKAILKESRIKKEIDPDALYDFFTLQFIPDPHSIVSGIFKLPPGYIGVIENKKIQLSPYWKIGFGNHAGKKDRIPIKTLDNLLTQAVSSMLESEVPLGAFLSGGIDSSIIVAMMSKVYRQKIKTFSIGFKEESYNELIHAREVAKYFNTDHHEFIVDYNIQAILPKIVFYLDEPFADSSAIPTYYLSKLAREYVTVAITGDGSDELLAGYRRYSAKKLLKIIKFIPDTLLKTLDFLLPQKDCYYGKSKAKSIKMLIEYNRSQKIGYVSWQPLFTPEFILELILEAEGKNRGETLNLKSYFEECKSLDPISQMLFVDQKTFLPGDILTKVDRMSMANSLETRIPFLSPPFAEFINSLPLDLKLKGFHKNKFILKKFAAKYLPDEIIKRKKQGFAVPIGTWLKNELKDYTKDILLSKKSKERGIFNDEKIYNLIFEHQNSFNDHGARIWSLGKWGIHTNMPA